MIDKGRIAIFMGYHYFASPLCKALAHLYPEESFVLVNPKDMVGSSTNSEKFDPAEIINQGFEYAEVDLNPPWCRKAQDPFNASLLQKFSKHLRHYLYFYYFKHELKKFLSHLNLKKAVFVTDQSYCYQMMVKEHCGDTFLIQPCYLDLWDRKIQFGWLKRLAGFFNSGYFPKDTRFGHSFPGGKLLIWEKDSIEVFKERGIDFESVKYPLFQYLQRKYSSSIRGVQRTTIAVLPANYELNHGRIFQDMLESEYRELIQRLLEEDVDIYIKIHPNEQIEYWRNTLRIEKDARVKFYDSAADRLELFGRSDFVISTNSFSAVEATLCGAVTINFNPLSRQLSKNFNARFERYCHSCVLTSSEVVGLVKGCREDFSERNHELVLEILGGENSNSFDNLVGVKDD